MYFCKYAILCFYTVFCAAYRENKMELMYFVIRHMEEASRVKRLRRRNGKVDRKSGDAQPGINISDY